MHTARHVSKFFVFTLTACEGVLPQWSNKVPLFNNTAQLSVSHPYLHTCMQDNSIAQQYFQSCDVMCTDHYYHPCCILLLAQARPKMPCIYTSNSTGMHSARSRFFTNILAGRALESSFVVLNSMCALPQLLVYTESLQNMVLWT